MLQNLVYFFIAILIIKLITFLAVKNHILKISYNHLIQEYERWFNEK